MFTVDFKFANKMRVRTVVGDEGIISMMGFDNGTKRYYVQLKGGAGQWFDEDQLEALDTCAIAGV